ncbi:MAG: hypothetical protein IT529_10355 [Burkholderiales bacterium]|nr:hypothetical protein [Burkholderiales bacterium]
MTPGAGAGAGASLAGRILAWRLPAIESSPAAVAFVQTAAGKLALFAVFAALMKLDARGMWLDGRYLWLIVTVAAALVSLAGRHRHLALLACGAALLAYAPEWIDFGGVWAVARQEGEGDIRFLRVSAVAASLPLALCALWLARRYREHPLGSHPVLAQHIVYCGLLGLAASHLLAGLPQVLLWAVLAVLAAGFSYFAYALIDQRHREPAPLAWQIASLNPFAWPTPVPMGRGAASWRAAEAHAAEELAVTQLKAVKLLVWAFAVKLLLWVYRWTIYQQLGVPPLRVAFDAFLRGAGVPAPLGLASVIANFPEQLLQVAIWGHVIIATLRLAGFRLLRNTRRPLSSRTIAEFWNRYLYYFKEVLVHVYFYPAFVRCFKRHPRLRLAFATFMAAGVGNWFLHFIVQTPAIARHGLVEALARSQTYAFYSIMLSAGIIASQLRRRGPAPGRGLLRGRLAPCLGVAAFFCLLSFFDGPQGHVSLGRHFAFLYHVLRVDRWLAATG